MNPLLDQQARQVVQTFAGCLLLPVRPGVDPDSVIPPLATAVDDTHRGRLATDSIVVVLGRRSSGLFVIRFEDQCQFQTFLRRNPESRSTLITSHAGQPAIWHRTAVSRSASLRLPALSVQMAGNALILDRGSLARADMILNPAPPTVVSLDSLDWGADDTGSVNVWLTTVLEGDMFRAGKGGELIPMRSTWRSYLVRRLRPHVVYETLEHRFYVRAEPGGWRPFGESELRRCLREMIVTAPVGTTAGKSLLGDAWVDRLVRQLRASLPSGPAVLQARLREFALECVRVERGSDITIGELYDVLIEYCKTNELPIVPGDIFQKMIPVVLLSAPWFRHKSKSITRPSGCQNGFRSLAVRTVVRQKFAMNGVVGVGG